MVKLSKRRMAQSNDAFMYETGIWHTLYTELIIVGIVALLIFVF